MKREKTKLILLPVMMAAVLLITGHCGLLTVPVYCMQDNHEEAEETDDIASPEKEVYELVNFIREAIGLERLSWSSRLSADARVRAKEASQLFSHTRPDGSKWYEVDSGYMYGENLACGYEDRYELVKAWIMNRTHFRNMTWPFKKVGIALFIADNGWPFWAMEFGY